MTNILFNDLNINIVLSIFKLKNVVIFCLLISFLFIFNSTSAQAFNAFEEDFESYSNGSFPSRWKIVNFPGATECPGNWIVENGVLKISIMNSNSCTTNLTPIDQEWNNISNNYVLEADLTFINGTDHNIIYKGDENGAYFYELHFQSPGDFSLNLPSSAIYKTIVINNYPNNTTYKLKMIVNKKQLKVFINNVLVRDIILQEELPPGRIMLRAGVGGDSNSETWFDNIKVTSINNLDVPLLKQTDSLWGNNIYDFAESWSPINPWIKRWGCALTSAAMVFQYHGYTMLIDGTELNPGSLNEWLKKQPDGFTRNGEVGWNALTRLSKQSSNINNVSFEALEFSRNESKNHSILENNINNNLPTILNVPGHFIVTTGIEDNSFSINDPFYERSSLDYYGNTFNSMRIFTPSSTDLSYFMFVVDQNIEISLKDIYNNDVGEQTIQEPLISPYDGEVSGENLKIVYLPKPESDIYTLTLTSSTNQNYQLDTYLYNINGEVKVENFIGYTDSNRSGRYSINFSKENDSEIQKIINFDALIQDIKLLYQSKEINNKQYFKFLLAEASLAKRFSTKPYLNKTTLNLLRIMNLNILRNKNKYLSQNAYTLLRNDINSLILQYQ